MTVPSLQRWDGGWTDGTSAVGFIEWPLTAAERQAFLDTVDRFFDNCFLMRVEPGALETRIRGMS